MFNSAGGSVLLGQNSGFNVFGVDGSGRINGSGAVLTGGFTAARLIVQGNAVNMLAGDAGCNSGFAGLGFGPSGLIGCTHYSLVGDGTNTIIGPSTGGGIFFREANADQVAIVAGGNVGVGTLSPAAKLEVNGTLQVDGTTTFNSWTQSTTNAINTSAVTGKGTGTNGYGVQGEGTGFGVYGLGTTNGNSVQGVGVGTGVGVTGIASGSALAGLFIQEGGRQQYPPRTNLLYQQHCHQ